MFVITAKGICKSNNTTITVFAGRDIDSYAFGEPCWCGARNPNVRYFDTIESAEAWFNAEKSYLLDSYLEVHDIAITEITYTTIKNLRR